MACLRAVDAPYKVAIRVSPCLQKAREFGGLFDYDRDDWRCAACVTGVNECFSCGAVGVEGVDVFRCARMCGKVYHVACLEKNERTVWLEGRGGGGTPASLEKCVGEEALYSKISACAAGPEGAALEGAAGRETLEKQSALTFVPWVVVDGRQLAGKCGLALKVACDISMSKGVSPLSPACSKVPELTTGGCPGAP